MTPHRTEGFLNRSATAVDTGDLVGQHAASWGRAAGNSIPSSIPCPLCHGPMNTLKVLPLLGTFGRVVSGPTPVGAAGVMEPAPEGLTPHGCKACRVVFWSPTTPS